MANTEENKRIARECFQAMEKKDTSILDNITDQSRFKLHFPGYPQPLNFTEGKKVMQEYINAFPDVKVNIDAQYTDGNYVITRVTYQGTHKGELQGIAPSNKQIKVTGVAIQRIENGKVVEEWDEFDTLGLMQQIGAVPEMEAQM